MNTDINLYNVDLHDTGWTRLCGGNTGDQSDPGTQDSCPEIAPIPGRDGSYALRDSANPDAGKLRFTSDELARLAAQFTTAA